MRIFITPLLLCAAFCGLSQVPTKEVQIKGALLAAPEELKSNPTVYGYNEKGDWVMLQKGTQPFVCLADDPKQPGLNVSCYHAALDPFMERGWQLKKEGKSFQEIFDIREKEVKDGTLKMPAAPSSLYVFTAPADQFDASAGTVKKGYLRYVIYIPYATAESTGLPLKPDAPGMPWIMDPGTHRAHIMINPPQQ